MCAESYPTLCDPVDCGGSSVHGISQAAMLEWVAIPFSRGLSQPRDRTLVTCVSCIGRLILYLYATGSPRYSSVYMLIPSSYFISPPFHLYFDEHLACFHL